MDFYLDILLNLANPTVESYGQGQSKQPQFGLDIVTRSPGRPHPQPLSHEERAARKAQNPSPQGRGILGEV
ncbi:MAG: hypothetical protein RLZZ597_1884 [Cyanobacteriota bacterium]|jgi:hypothetical protein